jgi:hypothetical protein
MPHPVIVIELFENKFEALYSNSELSFILVNRTEVEGDITISGPHAPTLEKADLTKVVDGVTILQSVLDQRGEAPFFTAEETP